MVAIYHKFVLDFTVQVANAVNLHGAKIVEQEKDMVVLEYPGGFKEKHILER